MSSIYGEEKEEKASTSGSIRRLIFEYLERLERKRGEEEDSIVWELGKGRKRTDTREPVRRRSV